ncbi:RNA 2',3'-cyclic phosphodiesterase [Planococcus sp. ISL-109]|uniref:RNA 2',3'-cyclic phosphodiesterase n=1 Tax=Planococcus sp. ISL-109 TaxID=2819166 RepID=UPI001BE85173|nr:RNA 2',3'-cyclic phosphodiesterase [Planococcus sp. ISL-109]MBT2582561.1 RNA 2',3'-cyclic phosphodiesterase [Planococcus sp. ISL-109]
MSTHYFIGIRIPAAVAEEIARARDSWELSTHKRHTPAMDMHITLLFIGEDRFGELPEIADRLADIQQGMFQLQLDGVKTFGNPKTPRIVYAAVLESPELMELQMAVRQQLGSLQMTTDLKPFVPHITLASRWNGGSFTEALHLEKLKFSVDAFSLFEIHPRAIPRYEEIQTYPLKGDA